MSMHDWDVQRKQWLWNEWKKENTNEEKQMSGRKEKRTDSDRRFNNHRFSRERMIHVFVWWAEGCFFFIHLSCFFWRIEKTLLILYICESLPILNACYRLILHSIGTGIIIYAIGVIEYTACILCWRWAIRFFGKGLYRVGTICMPLFSFD